MYLSKNTSIVVHGLKLLRNTSLAIGSFGKDDVDDSENVIWISAIISLLFKVISFASKMSSN